jgi:hypothetical protein
MEARKIEAGSSSLILKKITSGFKKGWIRNFLNW